MITDWKAQFDERQRAEISLAKTYLKLYNHGTTGHQRMVIIAKMAQLLDDQDPSVAQDPTTETKGS